MGIPFHRLTKDRHRSIGNSNRTIRGSSNPTATARRTSTTGPSNTVAVSVRFLLLVVLAVLSTTMTVSAFLATSGATARRSLSFVAGGKSPRHWVSSQSPRFSSSSSGNNETQQQHHLEELKSNLEAYRKEQSEALGKSPSMVINNKIIEGIVSSVPLATTREELARVKGLGPKKMELFGDGILRLVSQAASVGGGGQDDDDAGSEPPPEPSSSSYSSPDSNLAPVPVSAPAVGIVSGFGLDSYVAPPPYSYSDDEDEDEDEFYDEDEEEEEDEISEESFATSPAAAPATRGEPGAEKTAAKDEPPPNTKTATKKLRKTQLKQELKDYRTTQQEEGKAAYTVFTNAALEGIYSSLPTTKAELLEVKGIGPKKLELYGDDILDLVSKYAAMGHKREGGGGGGGGASSLPYVRRKKIEPESLTEEQRRAAEMILGTSAGGSGGDGDGPSSERKSVFVTGSAGTGKSHLLKYVVETLQESTLQVGVCAPTGVAAVIVGGSTLHSFFGIGLGTASKQSLLRKVRGNSAATNRINATDVLIIDECSMLSADLLEIFDGVARAIRKDGAFKDQPFGGMQVVAFGDFFQLPPVYRNDGSRDRRWRPFCFDSPVWSDAGLSQNIVELKDVQRQENEDFVHLLNKVRTGRVQHQDISELNQKCLVGPANPLPNDGILPTRLYVLNKDVDSENVARLEELKGKMHVFPARDVWRQAMPVGTPASVKKKMKDSLSMEMPDEVRLKVGAQVMLTRNKDLDKNLVNGSRGVVERIEVQPETGNTVPIVRFDSGIVTTVDPVESLRHNTDTTTGGADGQEQPRGCLARFQIPLKLAWAITIHKSQGSTLTRASLDISSAFEYGQCYVALSRVKSLEGLWLERPADLRNVMVSPQVLDFFGAPPPPSSRMEY